jgi:hypothetical protein
MNTKNFLSLCVLTAAILGGTAAAAQDVRPQDSVPDKPGVFVDHESIVIAGQEPDPVGNVAYSTASQTPGEKGDNTFVFVSSEFSFDGHTVKNAPYSAEAVTETVQTLGDGNRIIRKNSATIYRDSEGRTRRDQTFPAIGPYVASGDVPQTIFINDPVTHLNYILEPGTKTARKFSPPVMMEGKGAKTFHMEVPAPGGGEGQARLEGRTERVIKYRTAGGPDGPMGAGATIAVGGPEGPGPNRIKFHEPKTESLGKQTIEGVVADGTKTTITIPAGEMGNERPIEIVNERWYSPELQTVVLSKRKDPLTGDMTYRLTNINRNEPAATVFEVPADYKVKEGPPFREFQFKTKPGGGKPE